MNTKLQHEVCAAMRAGGLLLIALLMIGLGACSSAPQSGGDNSTANTNAARSTAPPAATTAGTAETSVPKSLVDAGEFGENIYDYAKANDWKKADAKIALLKEAVKQVRADVKNAAVDRLDADVAALDGAVAAKDRQAAMRVANQITLDAAEMSAAYKVPVPVAVEKLDYYGRELEIWAAANDLNKLQTTAKEMRKTWDAVRPSIETKKPEVAKKFEALVAQVDAAKTAADYARLAKPVLDEVDNLEKVFE